MIREAALLCIVCSSAGIGFLRAQKCSVRIRDLKEIERMLLFLQGELRYGNLPLPELFCKTARRLQKPFSVFLEKAAADMKKRDGQSLREIFSEQMAGTLGQTGLLAEDFRELEELGASFGQTDRETQLKTLEFYNLEISRKLDFLKAELPGRRKLCRSLGIMGGLFLVILLI